MTRVAALLAFLLTTTPDAGVDAGQPTKDAGSEVDKKTAARRVRLVLSIEQFINELNKKPENGPCEFKNLLLSQQSSDTRDGALLTLTCQKEEIGFFFYLRDGDWTMFPMDFK